ncbi:hypothetical protein KQI84_19215 [bacterium]|nr:hypothetical protein [bacterium]
MTSASSNTESQHGFLAGQGLLAGCISFILLTILAFSVTLVPIRADNDVWWHVKSGKYIAENGLPEHDVFSYTAAEYPWHNHEWLTQVAMWHIWSIGDSSRLGGWRAVILAKAITLWLTYILILILAQRISKDWWIALIVAALALAVGRRSFYPRPPVVSDFLLAGMILLLTGVNEKWWSPRWLIALPFVVGLWTNLHGAWMAGVVILAAYVGQDVFLYFRDRFAPKFEFFEDTPGRLKARWWIALFGACLLATLFNPFGIELYKLPARVMSEPALTRGIGELRSPDFYFAWISEFTLLGLIFLLAVVRGYRPRLAEIGILLFFAHQGIQHVRHLVLFGLAMTPILARVLAGLRLELHEWLVEKRQYSGLLFLGMGVLIVAVTLRNPPEGQSYPERNLDYLRTEEGYKRGAYPSDVVDFIELVGFDGRMFNENYYAGYLIWRLAPEEHLVFSDSRFDIFGGDILRDENIISGGVEFTPDNESWRSRLDYWDVNWIITKGHTGLATEASAPDSGWALVAHWPELSSGTMRSGWQIWVRDNSKNADLIERARRMFSRQYGRSITDG